MNVLIMHLLWKSLNQQFFLHFLFLFAPFRNSHTPVIYPKLDGPADGMLRNGSGPHSLFHISPSLSLSLAGRAQGDDYTSHQPSLITSSKSCRRRASQCNDSDNAFCNWINKPLTNTYISHPDSERIITEECARWISLLCRDMRWRGMLLMWEPPPPPLYF